MPATQVPGFLYDARGNPILGGMGNLHRRTREDDRLRPAPLSHWNDYAALLAPHRFKELVSESRAIRSHGTAQAQLEQKSDYVAASHFRPVFKGKDATYGATALPLIEEALKICNLRGILYSWKTTWRLLVPTLASDGQVYVLLTRWGDTRFPALQILEAHRIGQRDNGKKIIEAKDAFSIDTNGNRTSTLYTGLRISGGHIYNGAGTEIAYRVLGAKEDGSEDQDISARDLYRVARPTSYSEDKTPPEIAAAALELLGLHMAWEAQLDQQIIDSRLTLIETNATGKYDPGAGFGGGASGNGQFPQATPNGTPTTVDERGMTRIIKTGMNLQPHESARPADQWMNFQRSGQARAASSIRWHPKMMDTGQINGGEARLVQDQVNTLIQESFDTSNYAATRALNYITACLAAPDLAVLPLHEETMSWGIAPPPWVEVDRNSARIDLEEVAGGRRSMTELHSRDGHTTTEIYSARVRAYKEAVALAKKEDVPLEIILGDLGFTAARTGFYPQNDPVPDPTAPQPDGSEPGRAGSPSRPGQKPADATED